MNSLGLAALFAVAALAYASAGLGGGSAYGAILGLAGFEQHLHKTLAHGCNLVVVVGAMVIFVRKGVVPWKLALPLAALSMPLVIVGAKWVELPYPVFRRALALGLLVSAAALFLRGAASTTSEVAPRSTMKLGPYLLAPVCGLISGVTGIGGGIFLAPALHLMRAAPPAGIAATASFFILCNSLVGLFAQFSLLDGTARSSLVASHWMLPVGVFVGGQIGSRLAAGQAYEGMVRWITALVVTIAGLKILLLG